MWLIDRKHFYLGSANLDWRSYTQVMFASAFVSKVINIIAEHKLKSQTSDWSEERSATERTYQIIEIRVYCTDIL